MQNHSLNGHADEALVDMAQRGSRAAFGELAARHYYSCLKVALGILREREDAEDEVQNAFSKAFQHIGQFEHNARFTTWLNRIVVNQCLMRYRQAKRQRLLYLEDAVPGEDGLTLELPGRDATPEQQLGSRELSELLAGEIRRMPPLFRNAFLLRDVHRLPMTDVAGRLGISVPAAKSRLLRARLELRQRLARHCGRLGAATLTN